MKMKWKWKDNGNGRDIIRTQASSDCELQSCNQSLVRVVSCLLAAPQLHKPEGATAGELSANDESLLQGCVSPHPDAYLLSRIEAVFVSVARDCKYWTAAEISDSS